MDELKNIKILYVDDEDFIRLNAVEYLNFYCQNVYESADGLDAYEVYKRMKPDIIITDIKMPKMNGLELAKKIRENDKDTKIIIATAFLETSYLLDAVELGLIKYLIKPITEHKLLSVLRVCINDLKQKSSIFCIDKDFSYDTFNQTLFYKKQQVQLTKKEFLFLDLLVLNSNRAIKYEEINNHIWKGLMTEDALRSIVKELRKKISKDSIKNISGIGYQVNAQT